jgi:hypothetical protein
MTMGLVAMGTITDTATAMLEVSVKLRIRTSTIGTIITSGKAFTSSRLLQQLAGFFRSWDTVLAPSHSGI